MPDSSHDPTTAPVFHSGQHGTIARGAYAGKAFTIEHDKPRADGFWTVRLEYAPGRYRQQAFPTSMLVIK